MTPSSSVPSQRTHADAILDSAKAYASGKGYRFGAGADDYMRQHAINAGSQIDALPKSKQAAKLKEAHGNFTNLIDEMIEAAKTIPGYEDFHPGSIGEDTLSKALGVICPLWPFC